MADAVTTSVLFEGKNYYIVQFTNVSDGTGESAVQKIDISGLTGPKGVAPSKLALMWAYGNVQGFTHVDLYFDATADDLIATFSGNFFAEYPGGKQDPQSSGTTGDVVLTTFNNAAGNTYDITMAFKVKE